MDCFAALAMTAETVSRSRGAMRPGFASISSPSKVQRAQGMPDARCTRDLMRSVHKKCAHEHTGEAENIRHSLRNGFTAYNELSPVNGSFATVACGIASASLTPAPRRQDHTSLPYALVPFAYRHYQRPPRPIPRSWRS